jgi:phosphohistidine phosphatase
VKQLTLIRHGKSSWDDASLHDRDRPLNERGERDAPLMGKALAEDGAKPDVLVSSPAVRAQTTARIVAAEIGAAPDSIVKDARVYDAEADDLIDVIRGFDDAHDHVFLIGHNPGLLEVLEVLIGDTVPKFPTCAVASLQLDVERWSDVGEGCGSMARMVYPKLLKKKG